MTIEEYYDFSTYIKSITYIITGIETFLVSYVVPKILSRKINNIDMVSSLKGGE